ncbi:MAG TPA: HlyD family efflux transporter periplasmic adaptor subunit, partial [Burkholderiaceae bacterium]|nr:HlyD family efflux transporter periplasmic adaptor subunit [Burkholderiaceae bacterium]
SGTGQPPERRPRSRRRIGLTAIALAVILGGLAWGGWWLLEGRNYVTTQNAYVQGDVLQVTPQVSGTVVAIHAEETDRVELGQRLITLDATDARTSLDQAKARLGQAVREIRSVYANDAVLKATIAMRETDIARAKAELARVADDAARRERLQSSGAISREELLHAQAALASARSALAAAQAAADAARKQLVANQAQTAGLRIDEHPSVASAASQLREAWLALQRAEVRAPLSGHVARRSVQVGQRVQAGAPLMSIVPLERVWVEANFKESQLRDLRIGQPVRLTADLYGRSVEFDGTVVGLGVGTGAAFALLPPQNATGNWIKIVQRVPVRITLDPAQLERHPLRVGLSMQARVDVRDRDGPTLAQAPRRGALVQTPVFDSLDAGADEAVRQVIESHLGRDVAPTVTAAAR